MGSSLLTEREKEVLTLVSEGLTNAEIGAKLFISPLTAKEHLTRIFFKTGIRRRVLLAVNKQEIMERLSYGQ